MTTVLSLIYRNSLALVRFDHFYDFIECNWFYNLQARVFFFVWHFDLCCSRLRVVSYDCFWIDNLSIVRYINGINDLTWTHGCKMYYASPTFLSWMASMQFSFDLLTSCNLRGTACTDKRVLLLILSWIKTFDQMNNSLFRCQVCNIEKIAKMCFWKLDFCLAHFWFFCFAKKNKCMSIFNSLI